jgi:hypothetical protein
MAVHTHGNRDTHTSHYHITPITDYNFVCSHGKHAVRIPATTYSVIDRSHYYNTATATALTETDDIKSRSARYDNEPPVLKLLPCEAPVDSRVHSEYAVFLVTGNKQVYSYEPGTHNLTYRFTATESSSSTDIANSATKMWVPGSEVGLNGKLHEWDITLDPFTQSYNRSITTTRNLAGSAFGPGLSTVGEHVLVNCFGATVQLCDVSGTTVTPIDLFTMPKFNPTADLKYCTGDIIYNPVSDTYIILNSELKYSPPSFAHYYVTEYTSTGAVVTNIEITPFIGASDGAYGMFQFENDLYICIVQATTPPYGTGIYKIVSGGLELSNRLSTIYTYGASQQYTYITCNLPK